MNVTIATGKQELGALASALGIETIKNAIEKRGVATIIVATGTSQYDTLRELTNAKGIDWSKVHVFHLDEYVGLSDKHPASFRRYLRERFVNMVPDLGKFVPVHGENDPEDECRRLISLIKGHQVDVAFVGIGENGHLAFNDPPADFDVEDPYIVVQLDETCRKQQVGEGWFKSIHDVPSHAISMSIRQILKSNRIVVSVPDKRKAEAVKCSVEGPVSPDCPASVLQTHPDCHMFLDQDAASLLSES